MTEVDELHTKAADSEPDADPDDPCIADHMKKLTANGMSDADARKKAEAMCAENEMPTLKELTKEAEDNIVRRVVDAIKNLGRKDDGAQIGGFKVFKDTNGQDRWTAWYSNNFEDREKEFFSEKGFDRYVKRLDMGLVNMPELWSWHTPGSKYGKADWVDRIGHFHIATGTYDDTPAGRAGKDYDIEHWKEYGVSHGFIYRKSDVEIVDGKKVYTDWNSFEISPLPSHRAANELTAFAIEQSEGLKEFVMDAEKRKHLAEKYASLGGETYVAKLEAETEKLGKGIEEMKGFKDFVHPDTNDEAVVNQKALDAADQTFGELMPQLIEGSEEAVTAALQSIKAVKSLDAKIATIEGKYADAMKQIDELRKELDLKPRSVTQGGGTALTGAAAESLIASVQKQMTTTDPFTGLQVTPS